MCYLKRYDDLVEKYGRNWKAARKHYYVQGYKEERNYKCEDMVGDAKRGPQPIKIQNDKDSFTCNGDVHYARMSSAATRKPKTNESWEKVRNYGFFTVPSNGNDDIVCNSHNLKDES